MTPEGVALAGAVVTLFVRWRAPVGPTTSKIMSAVTDADGRFSFAGLNADIGDGVVVRIEKHGVDVVSPPFMLTAGEPRDLPPLIAERTGCARGALRDAMGAPVAGEYVCAREVAGMLSPHGDKGAATDAAGRFEIRGLRRGRFVLRRGQPPEADATLTEPFELHAGDDCDVGDVAVDT